MITLYGIRTCDTCRKALAWLKDAKFEADFHDLRRDGLTSEMIHSWLDHIDLDTLVNRRSTTWRQMDPSQQARVADGRGVDLLVENPTLMKRPLFQSAAKVILGFDDQARSELKKLRD